MSGQEATGSVDEPKLKQSNKREEVSCEYLAKKNGAIGTVIGVAAAVGFRELVMPGKSPTFVQRFLLPFIPGGFIGFVLGFDAFNRCRNERQTRYELEKKQHEMYQRRENS